jgi:hypothetical protein
MKITADRGNFPCFSLGRSTPHSSGPVLLLLFAFAMAGCGPSNDTTNVTPPISPSPPIVSSDLPPPTRSQAELAAAFDKSNETIFEATTGEQLMKVKPLRQVTFFIMANGLKVVASGTAPSLLLPAFVQGKKCILQVAIESPAGTPIKLFYSRREQPAYSESQAQTLSLKKGRNVVYFQLDQANLIDPLRLDPGTSAGDYIIESVVARATEKPATP